MSRRVLARTIIMQMQRLMERMVVLEKIMNIWVRGVDFDKAIVIILILFYLLDHTADVQCHTWGPTLFAALEAMAPCMFNYMTDLSLVEADPAMTQEFQVGGHDLHTVLFAYMDEMLFRFCTGNCISIVLPPTSSSNICAPPDLFCITGVEVLSLDRDTFTLKVRAHGATFERSRHVQGTEIKAITYSNMQVHEGADRTDIYVIVDI